MSASGALSAGTVSLGVKADTDGFGKRLGSQISQEASKSGLSGVGKMLGGTLLAGLGLAMAGVGAVIATGIGETKDAAAGTAQLEAGIKSTGDAANVSVKGMNDLASAIQGYSGQTDDSIVKSEQLLLTFTNIKNNGPDKIFDQATVASANMAAKMGGDASSQAILLGKALNDPVKGITALTRVGVSFTQGQKDTIKAMIDTGNTVGAQKVILGELNKEFGGAAKAAGDSMPGELAKGQRAFEDLSQTVVETLLPIVRPIIDNLASTIKRLQPVFQSVASQVKGVLMPALAGLASFLKTSKSWLLPLVAGIVTLVVALKAYNAISGLVQIATKAWAAAQLLLNVVMDANPFGLIVIAIAALVAGIVWVATQTTFFQTIWKAMTTAIGAAWNWLWNTVIQPVVNFIVAYIRVMAAVFSWLYGGIIKPVFTAIGAVFSWWWNTIVSPIARFVIGAVHSIGSAVGAVFGAIGNTIRGAFNGVVDFVRGIFNSIVDVTNGIIDGINGIGGTLGKAIGVNIHLARLPHLADSGTVLPKPGGTLAVIGEGGKAESVVDTGKLNKLMDAAAGGKPARPTLPESVTLVDADGSILARTHTIAERVSQRTLNSTLRSL